MKLTAQAYLILFKLGHIWFSSATVGLVQLSQPKGAETKWQPCTVHAEDRCEVGHCKKKVLIALILVLAVIFLTVIYAVTYAYGK